MGSPLNQVEQAIPVAVLLHHGGRQIDRHVIRHTALHQHLHPIRGACDHGKFVHRATAPHFAVLQLALERIVVPRIGVTHSDTVDVAVDEDLQGAVSDSGDYVPESINEHLFEAECFILPLNPLASLALVQALGLNRDHLPEETDDLGFIFSGGLQDRCAIRCHVRFSSLYLD